MTEEKSTLIESDNDALGRMLSFERLQSLVLIAGSEAKAIELHQDTLRAGAALMTVVATIEIALRNVICENLSQHFKVQDWLLRPPPPFQWKKPEHSNLIKALASARRAEYAKLTQAQKHLLDDLAYPNGLPPGKSHLDRARDRQRQIAATNGKVVAELTLNFWKRLCGPDYEQSLWRPTLKRIFPYKKVSRAIAAIHLEHIYQSRNRLAHHEPVLRKRFQDTVNAIEFVVSHLLAAVPSMNTPLARLVEPDLAEAVRRATAVQSKLENTTSAS